jgi:hypothetical protein
VEIPAGDAGRQSSADAPDGYPAVPLAVMS